jgi:isocitrate lyase
MGKGSTQFQHLVQTEVPTRILEEWLDIWAKYYRIKGAFRVELRPKRAGSDLLELNIMSSRSKTKKADVIFGSIQDLRGKNILSIRDQNTFNIAFRKKRLMTIIHLFLIHRYKSDSVHYVNPTDDNMKQTQGMKKLGIYSEVNTEVGDIIVAGINVKKVKELLNEDQVELKNLIAKKSSAKKPAAKRKTRK